MSAQARGWGPPGCTSDQLARVDIAGMVTTSPYFPLNVRREVVPHFTALCRWLVVERRKLGRPPLTCSGGYNKRLIRGSTTAWSEHSWGLAVDLCAAQNPMQDTLRTDMPPGTSAKARSLGMVWGGDYAGRKDPMHFEYVGSPVDARRPLTTTEDDMTPEQARKLDEVHAILTAPTPLGGDPTKTATPLELWRWTQLDANTAAKGTP